MLPSCSCIFMQQSATKFPPCHGLVSPSFCKSQLTSPTYNLLNPPPPSFLHANFVAVRDNKFGFFVESNQASAVGVQCHNHHAIHYCCVPNFTVYWHYPSPGLTLDIFLFPVAVQDIFFCPTTPWHLTRSIHQVDRAGTVDYSSNSESPGRTFLKVTVWQNLTFILCILNANTLPDIFFSFQFTTIHCYVVGTGCFSDRNVAFLLISIEMDPFMDNSYV